MNDKPLTQLYRSSSCGSYGYFDIEINVGASKLPDLKADGIWSATYDAVKKIEAAIMVEVLKNDPKAQERAKKEREELLALFPGTPFVEEIPNGYCPDWCCKHLPWFIVTTPVGRIKIGWRKSVIHLEWTETRCQKRAIELFPNEDVTRYDRVIHAWSYADAKRYIEAILASAK